MPIPMILYFAALRDRLARHDETVELPEVLDSTALLELIAQRHPEAREIILRCRVAVDHEFITGPVTISERSEIALIPPVSGG